MTTRSGRAIRLRAVLAGCAALLLGSPSGAAAAPPAGRLNPALQEAAGTHIGVERLFWEERYAEVLPLAERNVALQEKVVTLLKGRLPKKHTGATPSPELPLAAALDLLGLTLLELGHHARAEEVLSRSRSIYARILTPDDAEELGLAVAGLARLAVIRGDRAAVESLFREVTAHFDELAGRPYACLGYSEVGRALRHMGEYGRAEAMLRPAAGDLVAMADVRAGVLRNLADLALDRGEPEVAEPLLHEALREARRAATRAGTPGPRLARVLDSLGRLALAVRNPARAGRAFSRALAIQEQALGAEHLACAASLDGLALAYMESGEPARAEPALARALAIREKVLGPAHADVALLRMHLGDLRRATGDERAAGELYRRAQEDLEKALGRDHPAIAEALLRRAAVARTANPPGAALSETSCQRALEILEKAFGPDHPRTADALDALAETHLWTDRIPLAVQALARSVEIRDRRAAALLATGSEDQKVAAVKALRAQTDLVLSLPFAVSSPAPGAVELALTTVLRRKGRALDALAMGRAAVRDRQRPEDARLLRELVSIQGRIVDAIVDGPGAVPPAEHDAALAELELQKQRLEAELGKRSAALVQDDRLLALAEVQAAIPRDAALVELIEHRPAGRTGGAPHMSAYVLLRQGPARSVDLGEVRPIDALVAELRAALSKPGRDPAAAARALDERVMKPVRALTGGARHVLLSPDGELQLVPFGALVAEDGRVLLERLSFTYLSSGRELVRFLHDETPPEPGPSAVLIGAPDFGDPDRRRSRYRPGAHEGAVELGDVRFRPLPGTAVEVEAIGELIPGAKVLEGALATEEAVQAVAHPRILHIATHGFFLPPTIASAGRALDNPLLRSGLALATANQPVPGREDGLLTALEVAGLDLYGTRLVVLSACETGVGEARSGEGVYGLRRAVAMAGAQTLVMSLWKVSDEDTRDLMVAYHRRLQEGGGRSEALREAALSVRARPGNRHPFYWAGFIPSGDWTSLDGKDVSSKSIEPVRVAPGPRGCGCAQGPAPEGGRAALSIGALVIAALRRRRRRGDNHA